MVPLLVTLSNFNGAHYDYIDEGNIIDLLVAHMN